MSKISQVVFHVSMSLFFNSHGTDLPSFWIFPNPCERSQMVDWDTFNAWVESSFNKDCKSQSSEFLGWSEHSLSFTSKSPQLKDLNHYSLVFVGCSVFAIKFNQQSAVFWKTLLNLVFLYNCWHFRSCEELFDAQWQLITNWLLITFRHPTNDISLPNKCFSNAIS